MPIYTYQCLDCEALTDAYKKIDERNDCPICACGGQTKKIISNYFAISDLDPYLDMNIGSEPTWVKSKQHRKQLMKENGVSEIYGKGWK